MPVHDWPRVDDGVFHSFHNGWIGELTKALNSGLLPADYYALGDQIAGSLGPDVLTLQARFEQGNGAPLGAASTMMVAEAPPQVALVLRAETDAYARRRRTVVIRHRSEHRIIALVEVVSRGHKASQYPFQTFVRKAVAAIDQGIHLLLIDLLPPTPRDPRGMHAAVWEELTGEVCELAAGRPLVLAAYSAGPVRTAYVQPLAVGEVLPPMPLFLAPEEYVNVPLEATYLAAYDGVPRFYRNVLEA